MPRAGSGPAVLCVGRVQAIKGIDLFVRAGLRWLAEGAPPEVQFHIAGLDVVPEHESFRRYVDALIPDGMTDRFDAASILVYRARTPPVSPRLSDATVIPSADATNAGNHTTCRATLERADQS